jgi:RNA polymerase sigma factor (sigma-70 family)
MGETFSVTDGGVSTTYEMNMNALLDYPALSDRQLVELHLDGDRDAFRQIVERYQAMVCALGLSACGDVGRSEDIAQEVFIAVWKQLPELREPGKLRSWIGGIARNLIHGAFRRAGRTPTARSELLSVETPATEESPSDQAVRADESALMWSMLSGIPETYREPMVLFYREQRSVPAVAAALEISEDLVRQRLLRGRAMLTERMAKLVEESLERSAPTSAFASVVMLGLPFGVAPAVVVAEAGVAGGKAAAGGTMSKVVSAAGVAGGAVAKGGLVFKFLSALAFLPALAQGAQDFLRFRDRNATQADNVRQREAAWGYLVMHAGIGMFMTGIFWIARWITKDAKTPGPFIAVGLWIAGSIWIAVRAKCRMDRNMAPDLPRLFAKAKPMERQGFEQRSAAKLLGLPLYHVRLGKRLGWRAPAVKAWIAISDGSAVGGLFAFGPLAAGPVAMGIVSVGSFSIGIVSLGVWALGMLAAGWLSNGLFALGGLAAKGIFASAPMVASHSGHYASGAGEAAAQAFFHGHWFYRLTSVSAECFIWAGLLGWAMPLVLTGWHLWRTRRRT